MDAPDLGCLAKDIFSAPRGRGKRGDAVLSREGSRRAVGHDLAGASGTIICVAGYAVQSFDELETITDLPQ